MKAVLTVIGLDQVGIIAKVTAVLAENNINILDITQTIMQNLFTMIMLVDMSKCDKKISEVADIFKALSDEIGVDISITQEDIYKSMHRI